MSVLKWLAALALAVGVAAPARADVDARIGGTVRDSSNAFVTGAKVLIKNERTGEERSTTTNQQGYFVIGSLKPSTYTIKAEQAGFAPIEYTSMTLAVGQELVLDFELRPAGVQEAVTVTAAAPVLDLSSARIGVNVSEREVLDLPVNGRQMSQLMLQAPGSQNAGTGTWQDIRFSGRAVEQNAIRYDGIEGSAIIDAAPGNLNGEVATPFKLQASLENVQEFRVESNSYPAEYGTGSGGQVSVITKSGANRVHGSAFEYIRDDSLDAPNYFDSTRNLDGSVIQALPKSLLQQNQFGGSVGGPLAKDRAFFFGSYEGYRLKAGINIVEAVPSSAAWARAVPAIVALRPNFLAPGAVILPGTSRDPDFDIAQLQEPQRVNEDSFSGRVDFKIGRNWSSYVRFFHDQGESNQPDSVSGRVIRITQNPSNAVFNLQGLFSDRTVNEFKFGYNAAPSRINGLVPTGAAADLSATLINLTGSIANTGIAGQGATSGITVPGGLVRANSAQNGRGQPYDPYSLTFSDTLSNTRGNHYLKMGGEVRTIRMSTDRLGGTTYAFANLTAFLANQPSSVQFLGDESEPSVFNNGATGERNIAQEYYIAFAQDEWHVGSNFTLNYGLRYDYYTPLTEVNNLIVKFNVDTGTIDPNTTPLYASKGNNFQPRVSMSWLPSQKTALRAGFGLMVGPGQTEDQIQPVESDRISTTLSSGIAYPMNLDVLRANFINNPNNRQYQPRAFANEYEIPEHIYQYTASIQRELGASVSATAAYVGSQGRNLFLRSVTNQIVSIRSNGAAAATIIREFDIVNPDGSVLKPFAEVDYKTSGGHDQYNAMMLSLTRRSRNGLTTNAQYTLSKSTGNTAGSNEALTAGNIARRIGDFDYDNGFNNFDVRHTFNLSALYALPFGRNATGAARVLASGWEIGGIVNVRSGLPIDVRVTRPDILYRDAAGNVFANPAADRIAIINTPGGGNSRNVRRPDLMPGVDPFVSNGGLIFLNPAAFATPQPGTFGNLERNSIHGPGFKQVDMVISKRFPIGGTTNFEFRTEIFNLFNNVNFSNPVGTLPQAIPTASLTEANRVQPGQPYTAAAAGTFGRLTSTVNRTVGLGTPRQIQFAFRLNF
jgi:Carboxypeptidase regulatory-like domain/TonB dependent receptor